MIRRLLVAALLAGAALPAAAQTAPAPGTPAAVSVKPLAFTERTLANGLRVYAMRDTSTPNVAIQVWYDVGAKDDPRGRSGFAHLFEHLMFKATRNLVAEQFDRLTEDVGGYNNASTDDDYTNYFEVVPGNHLERCCSPRPTGWRTWRSSRRASRQSADVVKEEYRQRVLAQPYGKLFAQYLPQVAYQVSPYARPAIGNIADLEAASIDDVRAFHATYYRPDNAVLVVAGNFDPAQLDRWIDRYFAPIKRPAAAVPHARRVGAGAACAGGEDGVRDKHAAARGAAQLARAARPRGRRRGAGGARRGTVDRRELAAVPEPRLS